MCACGRRIGVTMLNASEKSRAPRKSLSLKKSKGKETTSGNATKGHADISKFFNQNCNQSNVVEDDDTVVQPKSKKPRNENALNGDEDTIVSKCLKNNSGLETNKKACGRNINLSTIGDNQLSNHSSEEQIFCHPEKTALKSAVSVSVSSSKVLRPGKQLLFGGKLGNKDSEVTVPMLPKTTNKIPATPFCSHEDVTTDDDMIIPPTPPHTSISVNMSSKNTDKKELDGKRKQKYAYFAAAGTKNSKKRCILSKSKMRNNSGAGESKDAKNNLALDGHLMGKSLTSSMNKNTSCGKILGNENHLDEVYLEKSTADVRNSIRIGSKENTRSNTNSHTSLSLQGVRKTYKLSKKNKKNNQEQAGKNSVSALSKTSQTASHISSDHLSIKSNKDEDLMQSYGTPFQVNDNTRDTMKNELTMSGGASTEVLESKIPRGISNKSLLNQHAENQILLEEKVSKLDRYTMKPRRSLMGDLEQDDDNTSIQTMPSDIILDDDNLVGTPISPHSKPSSNEFPQTANTCADMFDISMNSLNDEEVSQLMDGIPWSPHTEKTRNDADKTPYRNEPLISPAKLYVRRRSTELNCLASNLSVESAVKTTNNAREESDKRGYRRYLVLEVYRREIMDDTTSSGAEKVLRLFDETTNSEKYCQLREEWGKTEVEHGDIVNIVGESSSTGAYILDNQKENYVIVHPDILVTPTSISSSVKCLRRSVLEKHFKTEGQNEVMFLGTLLHAIFDSSLKAEDFSAKFVVNETKRLVQNTSNLTEMYGLGIAEGDVLCKVNEQAPAFAEWGKKYFHAKPHPIHGLIDFKDGATVQQPNSSDNIAVCVSQVVDIEECVWSPKFGLKGKVDATVEVKINKTPNIMRKNTASSETLVLPLELKTGKLYSKLGSVEHRAQVILYSLLMADRYPDTLDTGLLVYLKTGHMLGVPAYRHEKRALIMKRNEMVHYLSHSGTKMSQNMPGMLQDERTCNYCPQVKTCALYHRSVENGNNKSAGMGMLFDKMTNHLSPVHLEYFKKWNKLISLESKAMKESSRECDVWCLRSSEREQHGYCLSNMLLVSCSLSSSSTAESERFVNKFIKQPSSQISISDMHLVKGDYVVVSQEDGVIALATGFISDITEEFVTVLLDKNLSQCYHHVIYSHGQTLYRIDKAEISSGVVIQWSNLAKMFFADSEQDAKLRRLIADLEPPVFTRQNDVLNSVFSSQVSGAWNSQLSSCSLTSPLKSSQCNDELTNIFNDLNTDQRKAIRKARAAQDYALILGMPGTGKTTTIACLVRALVTQGKSVLLTSYTHSAVDNILLKLKQSHVDFLRLGSVQKIHADIQPYALSSAAKHVKTVGEMRKFYESKLVVATTCLGVNHTMFNQRSFDYCIVDEASQITQPVCFGSLRHASIFVLVGDHYQLPPLVQSHEAREGGMDISLFKRLSENHPQAVVNLEHQYRMHKDIMLLSNSLIYEHRLKCGTQDIAECLLNLPNWDYLCKMISDVANQRQVACNWLLEVLEPHLPVVFLDTDALPAPETRLGHNVYNETEADLARTLIHGLITSGLEEDAIGVISPYRHQLKVLKQHLNTGTSKNAVDVEINTVDKYQGRDKLCIIVSLVRCNAAGHVGDLLRDWRRVNVALTRAKRKLILLGSRNTLCNNLLFRELLTVLEKRSWIYNLPQSAWRGVLF